MKAERLLIRMQTCNNRPAAVSTARGELGEITIRRLYIDVSTMTGYADKTSTTGECHPTMSYLAKVVRRKPLIPVSNSDEDSISMI
jgi:hypothetical protein